MPGKARVGGRPFSAADGQGKGVQHGGNMGRTPTGGARQLHLTVADAELTVTDATPGCGDLLGIPGEELIGDSLSDVFLRAVRRAYADSNATVSLALARDARGSITVTFTLNRTSGTE